jgi:hypothetical protein
VSLAAIRQGIADNLATIKGVQISPYVLANPTPPHLWVRLAADEGILYHRAMGNGVSEWNLVVSAYVGGSSDIGAQKMLDSLLETTGDRSVFAAIERDQTLGGAAQATTVTSTSGYREYARADGSTVIGADWNVTVHV